MTAEYFQSFDHLLLISKNKVIKLFSVSQLTEGEEDTSIYPYACIQKYHTWSPRFKPASVALLLESTLSTKIPNPFSEPPSKMKGKGASRDGFVSVSNLLFALAAQAIFNSLRCPPIFCKSAKRVVSKMG